MDSTKRFSDRVSDYVKYRPGYPGKIVEDLEKEGILRGPSVVADVGSGTGIFSRLFVERGYRVFGVEPNAEMRKAGEEYLRRFSIFLSSEGTAEKTGLANGMVDLVTAAQAFHWFDVPRAKAEFRRILRSEGWVALVWNERKVEVSPFLVEYERLLKEISPDYSKVDHRKVTEGQMREFLGSDMKIFQYDNEQVFDLEGVKGRVMSSSYAPKEGAAYEALMGGVERAFEKFNAGGKVSFLYETKVYVGQLSH
jgi:SAM-dependent methyltransferase